MKVDRFANTIHGKMSNGATAFGDYSSNGAGAHVESGFRWVDGLWSVRPYLAFTGFTTDGQDYTLSNGMRADVGNTRILRAEAGTAVSYHAGPAKRYDAGTLAESRRTSGIRRF